MTGLLFVIGAAFGSFFNVIALRYDPDRFLLARHTWSGRSKCPHCGHTLRWFELVPFASFILQAGRCRKCRARLSVQYPLAELVSGIIFAVVPMRLVSELYLPGVPPENILALKVLFTLAFLVLLLMSLIDWRLQIIPDELTVLLALIGGFATWFAVPGFAQGTGSFFGPYALLFGFRENIFVNRAAAVLLAGAFMGLLFGITRGRGIGFGDVKLSPALALLFGWPDILGVILVAFVSGSIYGIWAIAREGRTLKSFLAFGPFLALGAFVIYLWGGAIIRWYFTSFFPA